jgi:hypothetical protein
MLPKERHANLKRIKDPNLKEIHRAIAPLLEAMMEQYDILMDVLQSQR